MNHSYWMKAYAKAVHFPSLKQEADTDILIIGGGLTGLSAAYFLSEKQQEVMLLEADTIAFGASGRNTGKLSVQHGLLYQELIKRKGTAAASLYYHTQKEALDTIEEIVSKHRFACGFQRSDLLFYSNEEAKCRLLEIEYQSCQTLGIAAQLLPASDDFPKRKCGLLIKQQAVFDPYAYCIQLAEATAKMGAALYEHSAVSSIEEQEDGSYEVKVNDTIVHANYVILATQFPFVDYGHFYFSYVINEQQLLYHHDHLMSAVPSLSVDADGLSINTAAAHTILTHAPSHGFPKLPKQLSKASLNGAWSSSDFLSIDHLPFIGKLEKHNDRLLFATGYSKWGNTTATAAGKLLCAYVLGQHPECRLLFSPQRSKPIFSLPYLRHNLKTAALFIQSRFISEDRTFPEPLEGKQILLNNHIYGAYRDEHHELFLVDITCPHAGCICQFNEQDKTWDCPCHGSRFSYKGDIIKGPATCALHTIHEEHNQIDPHILK